ncbi:hypothetical protein [Amycolatopsis rubida]|uniref:hypothetical protein n=1 Tax=Amycolatopsis rubida TaxID=112413 RepID=UPI000B89AC49|nr:hypothetical protein [Amycolatopsis rubida]
MPTWNKREETADVGLAHVLRRHGPRCDLVEETLWIATRTHASSAAAKPENVAAGTDEYWRGF